MLWSLVKILAFVAAVTALTYAGVLLMETDGGAIVEVAGIEFQLSALQLVLAFVALVVLVWFGLKLLGFLVATFKFLNGDETAISRYLDRNRERRGFDALADGMMALASGEGQLALTKATRAEKLLDRPELTNILTAQAAELAGDRRKAEETYRALLADDRTRFVGIRGLMRQKLEAGDTETALRLAEKAFALKPRHDDTGNVLLRLQAEKEDWKGARETLNAKLRHGTMPRDLHRRRDAVLALSEAKDVMADDMPIEAREAAITANRQSPDLIPAAVLAARAYIAQNQNRYAARVIRKAWEAQPHPDLAAAFAAIAPDETPQARLTRFRSLTRLKPEHPETRMLLAELSIAAEDFPAARRALGDLAQAAPTARVMTLMAAIERGEGAKDAVVRGWLAKALTAPRGPKWVCDNCHTVHAEWHPVCSNCKGLDTLSWKEPPEGEVELPAATAMLPLIVGQIESRPDAADAAPASEPEEAGKPETAPAK